MARVPVRYQYEPPVIPSDWRGQHKLFGLRLIALFDTLFQKQGQMERRIKELENRLADQDSAGEKETTE